jgi:hypothetical protein
VVCLSSEGLQVNSRFTQQIPLDYWPSTRNKVLHKTWADFRLEVLARFFTVTDQEQELKIFSAYFVGQQFSF